MTIREILKESIEILKKANIDAPVSKSKILLAYTLNTSKEYLLINENEIIENEMYKKFLQNIHNLASGTPLQYITKTQEFMGLNFYVDENVLIPRPDTEVLVENALNIIKQNEYKTVIDMCTGSGAIAISIAKNADTEKVYAIDISDKCISVANNNALRHGVNDKIEFIKSDMFENINNIKVDMIISNPPYIETDVIKILEPQVQNEPIIALDGGNDGLNFYRRLLIDSEKYLNLNGTICMEIGYNQGKIVKEMFMKKYKNVICKKDLAGNDRVIIANNLY